MPCIQLTIDHRWARIDTPDFEMAGKWVAQQIALQPITPATMLRIQVDPFFVPDPQNPYHEWIPDWDPNVTRVFMPKFAGYSPVDSMRELIKQLEAHTELLEKAT